MSGPPTRLTVRAGPWSVRLRPRSVAVTLALLVAALGLALVNLSTGDFPVPFGEVLRSLFGSAGDGTAYVVRELRLPRVLVAMLVGAALGISGAVFQSLTRNPLGSPDFIGLTVGAATGALVVMLLLGGSGLSVAAGALVGCLVTFGVIYLLAFRRGAAPVRLVLMGIGVSTMLAAFDTLLIVRSRLEEAIAAQRWLIGSVTTSTTAEVALIAGALAVLVPPLVRYGRELDMLSLGDETALAHGIRAERSRLVLSVISVALAAMATAVAGPIAFVALAAPQLASRLTRAPGAGIGAAAAMGAFLMTASDWIGRRVLPLDLPVGVVTAALGGLYLTWLLAGEWRRGRQLT
ncbi:iron chelate uptake ABC transporter family permease subunit [Asanoa sp. WMMD1127]|uniref:FecCD family ABC transporter permease n=1 Tax=Asanoa sp. WMMD1127 TaxID=3016107 RepID=UPI002416C09C|nr:iron chelate uptake ABC transporter family permease subunit [Asanoa sp. WMMD1127]MDG4825416.1 iron chelate uptake ABC transporter family permease subunit [Asanoa sp. WMMD1127]